jgi:hypothetical protein
MAEGPFDRGHVVWHAGLFRDRGRPWVVLSDERYPFHGEEYLVAGITTTERKGVFAMTGETWGDELLDRLQSEYGNHVAVGGLVEQLPREDSYVALDESTAPSDEARATAAAAE